MTINFLIHVRDNSSFEVRSKNHLPNYEDKGINTKEDFYQEIIRTFTDPLQYGNMIYRGVCFSASVTERPSEEALMEFLSHNFSINLEDEETGHVFYREF